MTRKKSKKKEREEKKEKMLKMLEKGKEFSKKGIKTILKGTAILGVLALTPISMHEFKEFYLQNYITKAANPVKVVTFSGPSTIGSSFQLKYKGKRVTVTNNHVCSVAKDYKAARIFPEAKAILMEIERIRNAKISSIFNKELVGWLLEELKRYTENISVVGESLRIGDVNREIVYLSDTHDICFLKPLDKKYLKLASGYNFGESIMIIGHPRGMKQSITDGRLVNKMEQEFKWLKNAGKINALLSTAISYPGNSGSPVVNKFGNVVGILFAGYSLNFVNLNIVVPLEDLERELKTYLNL